jgi:hypothetical protein
MRELTKAQFTVGILACFTLVWGLSEQALHASDQVTAFLFVLLQLIAVFILSFILVGMLEWVKVFDVKTNAILTLIVVVAIRLSITI